MSVQFGRWDFEGQPPAPDYIDKVSTTLAPYGPDSNESYSKDGIRILYRAFHTTSESRREKQPFISPSGAVITWDGRLDNRADLISELRDSLTFASTDVAIVAAAYEKWGANCLRKLIGDWALSILNPRERSVLLAKDPIGPKHLYYSFDNTQITWCTILDPLVRFAGKTFEICEEYIAGWLAIRFPAAHLTPYVDIRAVPPSSSVLLLLGQHGVKPTVSKYWDFDPNKRIIYRTGAEYEEHFCSAFAQAIQRRLRSDRPILAELSGGMDSSSIVCMADLVIAGGTAETPRLDTISYYDDSYDHIEPDWNEYPYLSKVETKRGATGHHINVRELKSKDLASQRPFASDFDSDRLAATPIPNGGVSELSQAYAAYMKSHGHRVILSGIGGDEATGGCTPTPTPELQNLIAKARFFTFAHQLRAWAAKMRTHQITLLLSTSRGFFTRSFTGTGVPEDLRPAPWLHSSFVRRNRLALRGYPSRVKLFGPLPSFQQNIATLEVLRRILADSVLQPELLCDKRFPYLDRDLLEFLYAVPREQIVGVGKRRHLMKRALVGIVPDELLKRRRKAFDPQKAKEERATKWPSLAEIGEHVIGSSMGIIDRNRFMETVRQARRNEEVPVDCLKHSLFLESWLRHLTSRGVLRDTTAATRQDYASFFEGNDLQVPTQRKSSAS
jgi:asparagine synthase (glutamine-hydrolysing)